MKNTPTSSLLLALLLACIALINADPYGSPPPPPIPSGPAPPPPFVVKGKEFPPETTICNVPNTTCFGQTVTCPNQCPEFKPANPKAKGCFIDCNSPKCEAVCKNRKPDCDGNGAACFDPRFVGGDGIMFYFHGKAGHHFTLVSDTKLQINGRFIGIRPTGRPRDFTWIQALGILFSPGHSFSLSASRTAVWDATVDHLELMYDGTTVSLDEGHRSTWTSPSGLLVERTAHVNSVTVTLPGVFEIMATAVPVTQEDSRIHRYGIPADDCFAHLEVQFRFFKLSERVEGVLGQTYRPDFESPVKRGVPMPVMGGENNYAIESLLSSTCNRCIFSSEINKIDSAGVLEINPKVQLDCTSKITKGYGVVCRR